MHGGGGPRIPSFGNTHHRRWDWWAFRCHRFAAEWSQGFGASPYPSRLDIPVSSYPWKPPTDTHTQVMDKYNIVGDVGAAIHLSPNVTRILPRWGIKTENLEPSLMSRYVERTKGGDVIKDVDLTVPNARWGYPRQMVHRPALHRELKRVATSAEGVGEPVEFLPKHRVVDVKPHVGVHMDSGVLVSADVFIGADGIKVGLFPWL